MIQALAADQQLGKSLDVRAAFRIPRRLHHHVLSFEAAFALFIFAGKLKGNPTFAWLFPIDATLIGLAGSLAIGGFLIWHQGLYRPGLNVVLLALPFVAWATASLFWSPSHEVALIRIRGLAGLHVWALAGAALIIARQRLRVYRFTMFIVLIGIAVAADWVLHTGSISFRGFVEDREYGGTARMIANAAMICFVFLLFLRKLAPLWMIYLGVLASLMYALMIVGSRGPVLGLVMLCLMVPLATGLQVRQRRLVMSLNLVWTLLFAAAGACLLAAFLLSGQMSWTLERMRSLLNMATGEGSDGSAGERLVYWYAAFRFWSDSLLSLIFGRGIGSFPLLFLGFEHRSAFPHNTLIEVGMETGVVGLFLFSLPYLYCLRSINLVRMRHEPIFVVLVMLFLSGLFTEMTSGSLDSIYQFSPFLALLLLRRPEAELAAAGGATEIDEEQDDRPPLLAGIGAAPSPVRARLRPVSVTGR